MQIGWKLVIETTRGIVSLWSDIQGDSFRLAYPLNINVPDEIIMKTLGVEYSKKVLSKYKFMQENGEKKPYKRWAKFYSERLNGDYGRVWVDKGDKCNNGYYVRTIHKRKLHEYTCGYMSTNEIWTYKYHFCTPTEPDAPNSKAKYIQPYRDGFIKLLVLIAKQVGNIIAINLDSGFGPLTPEILLEEGYKIKRWKEYIEYCYAQKNNVEIILEGEDYPEPRCWKIMVRYPMNDDLTGESLINLLKKFYGLPVYTKHMKEQEEFYKKILN